MAADRDDLNLETPQPHFKHPQRLFLAEISPANKRPEVGQSSAWMLLLYKVIFVSSDHFIICCGIAIHISPFLWFSQIDEPVNSYGFMMWKGHVKSMHILTVVVILTLLGCMWLWYARRHPSCVCVWFSRPSREYQIQRIHPSRLIFNKTNLKPTMYKCTCACIGESHLEMYETAEGLSCCGALASRATWV